MKDKGIDELYSVAEQIHKERDDVIFDVVGRCDEGGYDEKTKDLANKGIIVFHGFQTDVNPYLQRCHALIQPSYHEGLSNVLLEAAASGRPVLASTVPGCYETFDEGKSGIGFKARSVDSLYDAIKRFLMLTQQQRETMGINGRTKIEKEFDRQIVIDAYLDEIDNVLRN